MTSLQLRPMAFLVGAGVSFNSGCPLFRDFWQAYIEKITGVVSRPMGHRENTTIIELQNLDITSFPPEQLFYRLNTLGTEYEESIMTTLLRYLSHHAPNRNHFVLVHAMKHGAKVWTTNYDTLIEDAALLMGLDCHELAWPDPPICQRQQCTALHLFKPHGTFRNVPPKEQRLIYQSSQVLIGMDQEWREAFTESFTDMRTIVAGYSGNDVDIMPLLTRAAAGMKSTITWFEKEDQQALARLSHILPHTNFEIGDPSELLQKFGHTTFNLSEGSDIPARDPVNEDREPIEIRLKGSCLAKSILLDHFAEPERSRSELRRSLMLDPLRFKMKATRRLLRSASYDVTPINIAARLVTGSLSRVPTNRLSEAAWFYYLLFSETPGTSARLGRRINSRMETNQCESWEFSTRVSAASHLKLLGDFRQVKELINELDLDSKPPSLQGKAVYNLLWSYRYEGDLNSWNRLWETFSEKATLFDPNWAAWLQVESANLECVLGNFEAADAALKSDPIVFALRRRKNPTLKIELDISRMQADALAGAPERETIATIDDLLVQINSNKKLYTPFRQASLEITRAAYTPVNHENRAFVSHLIESAEGTTPSNLHLVFTQILRLRHNLNPTLNADELLAICSHRGFGYGEAAIAHEFNIARGLVKSDGARMFLDSHDRMRFFWVIP